MTKKRRIKSLLMYVLVVIGLAAICIGLAVVLSRFEILTATQTLMAAAAVFFAALLLLRHFKLSKDVAMIKAQAVELDRYENDIDHRLSQMTQLISTLADSTKTASSDGMDSVQQSLQNIEKRLEQLEADRVQGQTSHDPIATSNNAPAGRKINPLTGRPPLQPSRADVASTAFSAGTRHMDLQKSKKLTQALNEKSLSMHLQPIVDLNTRQPLFFDAFMRLKTSNQTYLDQAEFIRLADEGRLTTSIDKKIVFSSVRMLRKLSSMKKRTGVFCRISASTLSNARGFQQVLGILEANKSLNNALILEISQREFSTLKPNAKKRLGSVCDLGFRLCVADVLDLGFDARSWADFGVRHIKVPISILIHANIDEKEEGLHPAILSTALKEHNISVIATDVERDSDALSLIDLDIPMAHGLLFAPPRPIKAELLDGAVSDASSIEQKAAV